MEPSAADLHALFAVSPQGVLIHDAEGRVCHANPAAQRWLGQLAPDCAPSVLAERLQRPDGRAFPEDQHPLVRALAEQRDLERVAVRCARAGEPPAHLELSVRVERGPGAIRAYSFFTDVTERVRAERALHESEARFRGLFETMHEGFFLGELLYDRQGTPYDWRFLDVNRAHARIIGMTREEVVGKTVYQLFPGLERSWFETHVRAAVEREPFSVEGFVSDTGRYYENHYYSPAPGQLACIFSDITERKQGERALRESEARFAQLFELCPVGLALVQRDGQRIVDVNQAWTRYFGYTRDEVVGRTSRELALHVDEAEAWLDPPAHAPGPPAVLQGRTKGGALRDMAVVASPVQVGAVPHLLCSYVDQTEQQAVQRALASQSGALEAQVARRTHELGAAKAEAERHSRAKSVFLANMSHELRTPLGGVLGLAELALDGADHEHTHTFRQIVSCARHALGVIDDILDFSRMEAEKLPIAPERVLVRELLADAVRIAHAGGPPRPVSLTCSVSETVPRCLMVDPLRLRQIVVNLVSNALKFTERGRVSLRAEQRGGQLCLHVEDTGIGMTSEQLARVFAPFEQADPSAGRRFGGSGLGLAITERIVALLGGSISVTSDPGRGTRFLVQVPAPAAVDKDLDAAPPTADHGPGSDPLRGIRALVVEDNPVNQQVLREMLRAAGAEAETVSSGEAALAFVAEPATGPLHVVLMDLQMPDMDGYETTRRLRALAPALPVIAQSAHALGDERARCAELGMVESLTKPIPFRSLVDAVRRHARR